MARAAVARVIATAANEKIVAMPISAVALDKVFAWSSIDVIAAPESVNIVVPVV
jgi:hypothetical protein